MSHEIEKHDHVVLHRQAAWHGLGTIVENAPTPSEALAIARLDWDVQQWPMSATDGEGTRITVDHVAAPDPEKLHYQEQPICGRELRTMI